MGEGKPISTPTTLETHTGSATATQGANTNLDPNMQGGPSTTGDKAAMQEIKEQHTETDSEEESPQSNH